MMLGGAGSQALYHFHGSLVVAVHEIHFKSFDAHVGIGLADGFQVLVYHVEHCPEYDAYAFLAGVFDELRQLDFVYRFQDASFS